MTTAEGRRLPAEAGRFPELTLEQRWRDVLLNRGDAIAAADDGGSLTYRQLDEQSEVLARRLDAPGLPEGDAGLVPVAVITGHDRSAAVAALACIRLGLPCINLDPDVPLPRLLEIVSASGARFCIAAPEHAGLARQLGLVDVIETSGLDGTVPGQRTAWKRQDPDGILAITYTSGSTGVPKGVAVRFRTIGHQVELRSELDWLRPEDSVAVVMPLSFGAAQGEITSPLFSGAAIHFYDPRVRGAGPLVEWLDRHRITVLAGPPSLLTALVKSLGGTRTLSSTLRWVRSSGEKVLCTEARSILAALPAGCRLVNAFGSSEATLISSFEITDALPDVPRPVPAGRPLPGVEIRLEREDGTEPPEGEPGELLVVSAHLPAGYWLDEIRTRQRYTPQSDGRVLLRTGDLAVRLPNGTFRLAGRKDLSLKIRGNLVEPAEVEAALLLHPAVEDAVVVGRTGRDGHDRLVAYVVPRLSRVPRTAELRRGLRDRLPSYMIPQTVVYLSALPRNNRGKLDRAALPEPPQAGAAAQGSSGIATGSRWERRIADLWRTVLEVDEVGSTDDFFDLGGDSLAAEEMVARLAAQHHVEVSSRLLIEAPTVAEFAARLEAPASRSRESLVALRRTGSRPPLFFVGAAGQTALHFVDLTRRLPEEQPVWALQMRLDSGRQIRAASIRGLARRHVASIRRVQPEGPYLLAGHSFGGLVAYEMAQQLRAAGCVVALLAPLDCYAPHPRALPPIRLRSPLHVLRVLSNITATTAGKRPEPGVRQGYTRQGRLYSLFYRGKSYGGRTLVVVAADDPQRDWRSEPWAGYLTGSWRIAAVPGTHASMMREPLAAGLASVLDEAIRETLG